MLHVRDAGFFVFGSLVELFLSLRYTYCVNVDTIDPAGFTSLGLYSVSIPNNLNTVDICVVATLFYTNNIYLNNLRICQD